MVEYSIRTEDLTKTYEQRILKGYYDPGSMALGSGGHFFYSLWKRLLGKKVVIYALNRVNLAVRRGELVCILGPNGSGKTTLIKILAGLLLPTAGRAWIMGNDVVKDRREVVRAITYIPSFVASIAWANPAATVWTNLQRAGKLFGFSEEEIQEALKLLDIHHLKDRIFGTLSSGQQARVTIALGLLKNARVFLLDEPTMGLSPEASKSIREYLKKMGHEMGATVLYATNIVWEAMDFAERVVFMDDGRIIADGNLRDIIRKLGMPEVVTVEVYNIYFKPENLLREIESFHYSVECVNPGVGWYTIRLEVKDSGEVLSKLLSCLVNMGGKVRRVEVKQPDLVDTFIRLMQKRGVES